VRAAEDIGPARRFSWNRMLHRFADRRAKLDLLSNQSATALIARITRHMAACP